jgi:hypothetical protein
MRDTMTADVINLAEKRAKTDDRIYPKSGIVGLKSDVIR